MPNDFVITNVEHDKSVDIIDDAGTNRMAVDAAFTGTVISNPTPPKTFSISLTGNQTNLTLITPASGKKIKVFGVYMTSNDAIFNAKVEFLTSSIVLQEHNEHHSLGSTMPIGVTGAVDEVLTLNITNSNNKKWFIQIAFDEI